MCFPPFICLLCPIILEDTRLRTEHHSRCISVFRKVYIYITIYIYIYTADGKHMSLAGPKFNSELEINRTETLPHAIKVRNVSRGCHLKL